MILNSMNDEFYTGLKFVKTAFMGVIIIRTIIPYEIIEMSRITSQNAFVFQDFHH